MQKQVHINMDEKYPFGQLAEVFTENTRPIVKKTLHFQNQAQHEMIRQMVYLLNVVKHDNLVNVERVLEGEDCVDLYYEYAPFRLEKWLLEVNEEAVETLEKQLLDVVEYLNRSSFKFEFDPSSVGLSSDMTIKYFLNEFSIDMENQKENLKIVQRHIKQFFLRLCQSAPAKAIKQRESLDIEKCRRFQSVSTNASIQQLIALSQSLGGSKRDRTDSTSKSKVYLSQKVEDSMKKSLEVLQRFKKASKNKLL